MTLGASLRRRGKGVSGSTAVTRVRVRAAASLTTRLTDKDPASRILASDASAPAAGPACRRGVHGGRAVAGAAACSSPAVLLRGARHRRVLHWRGRHLWVVSCNARAAMVLPSSLVAWIEDRTSLLPMLESERIYNELCAPGEQRTSFWNCCCWISTLMGIDSLLSSAQCAPSRATGCSTRSRWPGRPA